MYECNATPRMGRHVLVSPNKYFQSTILSINYLNSASHEFMFADLGNGESLETP